MATLNDIDQHHNQSTIQKLSFDWATLGFHAVYYPVQVDSIFHPLTYRITLYRIINSTTRKYCSVAFI